MSHFMSSSDTKFSVSWERYLYDIVFPSNLADGPTLVNRSVFAMTDSGAPDGIKLDTAGNVYAGW